MCDLQSGLQEHIDRQKSGAALEGLRQKWVIWQGVWDRPRKGSSIGLKCRAHFVNPCVYPEQKPGTKRNDLAYLLD